MTAGAIASERAIGGWRAAGIEPDSIDANVALGRAGPVNDTANMIVFLAGDTASYVSGQRIEANGGANLGGGGG